MRLDNQRESSNVEDDRSAGGMGFPGGGSSGLGGGGVGMLLPLLLNTIGFRGVIILAVLYFGLKMFTGFDLLNIGGGGGAFQMPTTNTTTSLGQSGAGVQPGGTASGADAASDPGKHFVAKVLGSTEDTWTKIFADMGKQYEAPHLVLFTGFAQSACGTAQSSMGPFYCPGDHKVYIDLAFYQEMKDKLGAPGDFAQAYVVAHEVGHHVQNLLGIADQVEQARRQAGQTEANHLSVKMELQADCFAGIWATAANAMAHILVNGDIEQALNAASQIGDDHLQKASRGYAVPDTFTHGTSQQRVHWFQTGLAAKSLNDCDTFSAASL
jgi:uncharacterized protein